VPKSSRLHGFPRNPSQFIAYAKFYFSFFIPAFFWYFFRKWSIGSFSYKLPYNYNFARSFNEELMAVKKWIKKVHGVSSEPFKPGGSLPADLMINVSIPSI
jgi:hypothetical protein